MEVSNWHAVKEKEERGLLDKSSLTFSGREGINVDVVETNLKAEVTE